MPWKKILNSGDSPTELAGTAYRLLYTDNAGDVQELAHGAANKVLTSQGASANPTWEDSAGGAHALDAGQTDVVITTPADNEVLAYDSGGNWINQTAAEAGLAAATHASAHENGGSDEISVADLSGLLADGQTPLAHATSHKDGGADVIKLNEFANPTGAIDFNKQEIQNAVMHQSATEPGTPSQGQMYYDTDDDHIYVYVV